MFRIHSDDIPRLTRDGTDVRDLMEDDAYDWPVGGTNNAGNTRRLCRQPIYFNSGNMKPRQ